MTQPMQTRRHPIFVSPRRVSPLDRSIARGFDLLIAAALFSLGDAIFYALGVVLSFGYLLLQDGWGPSVGKRLFGLRVLHDGTDRPASVSRSAMRNVPFALGVLFAAVPAFWIFFVLVFLPLLALEVFFVLRLDSGARLGDVLADTYVDGRLRRPSPLDSIGGDPSEPI